MAIYTLGHSKHSQQDFLKAASGVKTVIDVRSHPSSKWEWFRKEQMEIWLPENGLGYEWWPSLGGWTKRHEHLIPRFLNMGINVGAYTTGKFPKQAIVGELEGSDYQPTWTNPGLHDYEFFLSIPEAIRGVQELIERGAKEDVAIICSEAVPWRCHRSMISDALAYKKIESFHIMPRYRQKNKVKFVDGYKLTQHSSMLGNRLQRYQPYVIHAWNGDLLNQIDG